MRDIKRIKKILKRLEKIWEKSPDLRLGQLILNAFHSENYNPMKGYNSPNKDFYYIEDEKFIDRLESFYKRFYNE